MKIRLPYIVVLIVMFSCTIFGQTAKQLVRWSADPGCGIKSKELAGVAECDKIVVDGNSVRMVYINGLAMALAQFRDREYLMADIYVYNASGHRILVDPQLWDVTYYDSLEDYKANKMSDTVWPIPPKQIASKAMSRIRWGNAFAALGAGFQTQTATVRNSDGSSSTVRVPDYAARQQAADEGNYRLRQAGTKADNIMGSALFPNTLFDQSKISGVVYYKLNKKAQYAALWVNIDGTVFLFDLGSG